jgi:UPF0755 protein
MTLRSGGRPRDGRAPQARPFDPEAYATADEPLLVPMRQGGRGGRGGGGGGSGIAGLIRFLVFALVLGGIVLGVLLTALRPLVDSAILGWAHDNPAAAMNIAIVKEMVREDLGASLTDPVSNDDAQAEFVVAAGDTASAIGARLENEGLIRDQRAFLFIAMDRGLTADLQQGTFLLRKNMTPDEVVTALLDPPAIPFVEVALRTGLRLEQLTAKLQTLPLQLDPREFYDLAVSPPKSLIDDYPWLKKIRADGGAEKTSLEGFLWPAAYKVLPDTTADELIRLMLDNFIENVGQERLTVPKERGLTFYQVITLASIVEREAVLDEERALIAGVYQNRLDGLPGIKNKILNADPTVIWLDDTMELAKLDFETWQQYSFWSPPDVPMKEVVPTEGLEGYQTYLYPGLIPGPIATPTLPSIDAALEPDTADKFLYFVAIPDGGGKHSFAKNAKEFDALLREYGYR